MQCGACSAGMLASRRSSGEHAVQRSSPRRRRRTSDRTGAVQRGCGQALPGTTCLKERGSASSVANAHREAACCAHLAARPAACPLSARCSACRPRRRTAPGRRATAPPPLGGAHRQAGSAACSTASAAYRAPPKRSNAPADPLAAAACAAPWRRRGWRGGSALHGAAACVRRLVRSADLAATHRARPRARSAGGPASARRARAQRRQARCTAARQATASRGVQSQGRDAAEPRMR